MGDRLEEQGPQRACPVCDSIARDRLFRQRFATIEGASVCRGYDVVLCAKCSFGFADRGPSQRELDDYYERASKYEHEIRGGAPSPGDVERFAVVAREVAAVLPKGGRVVEIGCSTGGLLELLRGRHGFERVSGIDPSPACRRAARALYDLEVVTGTLGAVREAGPFDGIILQQVLEHVVDLEGAIKALAAGLAPGGYLFIEVPDVSRFAEERDPPFQQFSVEHMNYFSYESLANLLARHGFRETYGYPNESTRANAGVFGAFQLAEGPPALRPDPTTGPSLRSYVEGCERSEALLHQRLATLLSGGRPLYVWGAGTLTLRLLETSALGGAPIRGFVDSNPRYRGKSIRGVPILSPDQLQPGETPILISTLGAAKAITRQLAQDLRLPNPVWPLYESAPLAG